MNRRLTALLGAILAMSLLSVGWADHCQPKPQCPTPQFQSVYPTSRTLGISCPTGRPTVTSTGVPIRYVDVPVPRTDYYYGNGGYGYGYGAFGYGYGGGGGIVVSPSSFSTARRKAPRRATRRAAQPDPRSARNYQLRKALNRFARENSVGGRLYVTTDSEQKWLLEYDGQPRFKEGMATIPCVGKLAGGQDRPLTLTLYFEDGEPVLAEVEPRLQ